MTPKSPTKECPWCHEPKTNVSEHKKICPKRPTEAALPPAKRQYRRRKVTARHVPERRKARRARLGNAGDGRTEGCQVCGLNVAERALVGEAIRAGLGFDNAVGFIRQARATFGKESVR